MQITPEWLRGELAGIVKQRDNFEMALNQAKGAVTVLEQLLARLEAPEPISNSPPGSLPCGEETCDMIPNGTN